MKQKKCVKLLAVIPLACMLSAPVAVAPVPVFAAETQNEPDVAINMDTLKYDLYKAANDTYYPDGGSAYNANTFTTVPTYRHYWISTEKGNYNPIFELGEVGTVTATEVKDITGAEDMQVATYRNDSNVEQTYQTPAKAITNTDSFTYSNTEGAKLGASLSHTVSVNAAIPGIGGASSSTTGTITTEFTYTHSSSNTLSRSETITFPSQTVVAAPNGTTKFINQVQRVAFSGTTENTGYLTGNIVAEYKRVYGESYGASYGLPTTSSNFDWDAPVQTKSIYDVFKDRLDQGNKYGKGIYKLPDYLELDTVNQRVILKKPIQSTFSGKLGFKSDAQVEFIPNDTSKATVRMSLADYQNPTKRMQTLQK